MEEFFVFISFSYWILLTGKSSKFLCFFFFLIANLVIFTEFQEYLRNPCWILLNVFLEWSSTDNHMPFSNGSMNPIILKTSVNTHFLSSVRGLPRVGIGSRLKRVLLRADFLTTQINVVLLKCSFIIVLMLFISILLKGFFFFYQHTSGNTALTVCGVFNQVSILGYSVYVS